MSGAGAADGSRFAGLVELGILDAGPDEFFDRLVQLAARLFEVPIAHVSLLDESILWLKAKVGIEGDTIPRSETFCHWAVVGDEAMVIPDARLDERFADNPRVVDAPHIRFYAAHPIRLPDGEAVGTLCVIDREPRELTPAQLGILGLLAAQAEWELSLRLAATADAGREEPDAFLATVTHDLRNPIAAILGFARMLEHDDERLTSADRVQMASAIARQATHLGQLVDDLMTIGVLGAGHRVTPEVVAVGAAIEGIVTDSSFAIPVDVQVPASIEAQADPARLRQMVVNLVANAANHGAANATVVGAVSGEWVELRVLDDGPGVPPDVVPRLFERFSSNQTTSATGERSTGLGLSIVRALARAHGGDAWYEPLPSGSCFALRLPRAGSIEPARERSAAPTEGRLDARRGALAAIHRLSSASRRHQRALGLLVIEVRSPTPASEPDAVPHVARLVARLARMEDLLFQWDAGRLLLILPDTDTDGARQVARRLTTAVGREPLVTPNRSVVVDVRVQTKSFLGPSPDDIVSVLETLTSS